MTYCKVPKFSDAKAISVIYLKLEKKFNHRVMHPKDADSIANSEDPEQSDLGLHCLPRPICPKTKDHYGTQTILQSYRD